jgi:hypothetical protein
MLIHCDLIFRHILGGSKVARPFLLGEQLRKRNDVADTKQDAKAQKENKWKSNKER